MACCGQARAAAGGAADPAPTLRVTIPGRMVSGDGRSGDVGDAVAPAASADPVPERRAPGSVRVRFTRESRVRVRGPVSGREYEFSPLAAVGSVDARDAEGLVGTGFFRRVY